MRMRSWTLVAVVALVMVVLQDVGAVRETSTMTRRKRMIEDASADEMSTMESERMLDEEMPQVRSVVEVRIAEPVPVLDDEDSSSTIGSERRLEDTTQMMRLMHNLEKTPALARRLMMKRMSEADMTTEMSGKLAARGVSAVARVNPRGLLDGLLGGGGSGGNCTASGGTVSNATTLNLIFQIYRNIIFFNFLKTENIFLTALFMASQRHHDLGMREKIAAGLDIGIKTSS